MRLRQRPMRALFTCHSKFLTGRGAGEKWTAVRTVVLEFEHFQTARQEPVRPASEVAQNDRRREARGYRETSRVQSSPTKTSRGET